MAEAGRDDQIQDRTETAKKKNATKEKNLSRLMVNSKHI